MLTIPKPAEELELMLSLGRDVIVINVGRLGGGNGWLEVMAPGKLRGFLFLKTWDRYAEMGHLMNYSSANLFNESQYEKGTFTSK